MDRQKFIIPIIFLIVFIGIIAMINTYYIKPAVLLQMPNIEEVNVPNRFNFPYDANIFKGSMEEIQNSREPGKMSLTGSDMIQRNPFLWPEESQFLMAGQSKEDINSAVSSIKKVHSPQKVEPIFNLSMVVVGENLSLAVVNNQFVTQGSSIQDYDVVKIEPQLVLLENNENQKRLRLESEYAPLQYCNSTNTIANKKQILSEQNLSKVDFQQPIKDTIETYLKTVK